MIRRVFSTVLLLLVPVAVFAQAKPAPNADKSKPTIDIPAKIKDFGTVPKGEKIKAVFDVRNTGTAPLELTQVRPTCGCTVTSFDHNIQPGATGHVVADVDTSAFNGPISKAVLVYSNDPATPQVNLVIKAEVKAFIEVRPRPFIRFNALQGEPASNAVTLVSADGSNFKVTGVETNGSQLQVTYEPAPEKERFVDAKGSQWRVNVTLPADAPEGMINSKVEIKTTSPKAPVVTVNVNAVVRPIVQVIPGEINFGRVPAGAPVGRNVLLINNRQGASLEVTDTKLSSPDFKVEVIPLQAGQRYQVAVSLPAGASKGTHKAELTITTNDPVRKEITVPIQAEVQ